MMNQSFRRRAVTLLVSSLLLFVLAACGAASADTQTVPTSTSGIASTPTALPDTGSDPAQAVTSMTKLNLNSASAQDFLTIPGLGSRMVKEFQEYRPYTSILQFRQEIGKYVDASQVAEYEKYVYVPVSVNDSDAATLLQIPGLDQTEAAALIARRPYASNEAFLARLAQYVSEDQLATAKSYLNNQ